MGKIFCLMGKSATGKDTIYRNLLENKELSLKKVVPYTTRPIRAREMEGQQYFFVDDERFRELQASGKMIESRAYNTIHGVWYYFTVDDGQIELEKGNYLIIGTLESYLATRAYYGQDKVIPIYVEIDDGERLSRALRREKKQAEPKYEEMCRRFLADAEDFSVEKLEEAGIKNGFENINLEECINKITAFIRKNG